MNSIRLFLLTAALATVTQAIFPKISKSLSGELSQKGSVNILVSFLSNPSTLNSLKSQSFSDRGERTTNVKSALSKLASSAQKPVIEFLNSRKSKVSFYKSFWIANVLWISNADLQLVEAISHFPEVLEITEDQKVYLNDPIKTNLTAPAPATIKLKNNGIAWGVAAIGAPQVWAQGYDGSRIGIVIGSIDTGARATHEALRDSYFGEYGWFDAIAHETTPFDPEGHGTHTIGTFAGTHGIGVAPGAKWMSCRAFDADGSAYTSHVIGCFQFMACPTDPLGQNEDCTKAAHIVSNSWSSGSNGLNTYTASVASLHSLGIIPVFASGNEGDEGCGSTKSPGDGQSISVGSVGEEDELSVFSSIGPGGFAQYGPKPDFVAPGEATVSAGIGSDTLYATSQGTSMATPLVSGAIALLLDKNPNLTYDEIRAALIEGAHRTVGVPGNMAGCGGIPVTTIPNHSFGHGRINILASMYTIEEEEPEPEPTTTPSLPTTTPSAATSREFSSLSGVVFLVFAQFHNMY